MLSVSVHFIFKGGSVSLGLWFQSKKLFLENTRFSFYVGWQEICLEILLLLTKQLATAVD